jgi:hypothetical protein
MIFEDETEVTHSHLIEEGENKIVEVHFERPTENGFDMARCSLPSYEWIKREGYLDDEIYIFDQFLKNNAHLLYKYAESGGIKIP